MSAGPARYPGNAPIEAYGNGGFRFAGMSHRGSILCTPREIMAWDVRSIDTLQPDDLAPILTARDAHGMLLLLGTGASLSVPSPDVRAAAREANLWLEVMDTGAACRTYNVLLAEQRVVCAALIAVD